MNTPTQQAPLKIDEKAQIVFSGPNIAQFIVRFKSVKNAEKEYKRVQKVWQDLYKNAVLSRGSSIHAIKSDMFDATIDLRMYSSAAFIIIEKRLKFSPYVG